MMAKSPSLFFDPLNLKLGNTIRDGGAFICISQKKIVGIPIPECLMKKIPSEMKVAPHYKLLVHCL